MQDLIEKITNIVGDPFNGPFEGEDYCIEDDGTITVPEDNAYLAGSIICKVNNSKKFKDKLVRLGKSGGSILIGFDALTEVAPVETQYVGIDNCTRIDVKINKDGQFCVYVDGKRMVKVFKQMSQAKRYINTLDKKLKTEIKQIESSYDDYDSEE